ncbi:ribonuclease HII [Hydrogenimonas thermophila]|uniref:Ribonuclease HII n=1 Tax=Hydrogenimonas thermophila TaxID=223786 RepID=A0A1I5T7E4_9BACT|nr:ribonuclease HII [Hydrogenimonas thermophila]SFP78406.1 RNase HII [Hydrogenimonas thermophila]
MKQLCGIDEAGRGPVAGPLVMAGVILKDSIDELNDSKKLTEKKREKLYDLIIENSIYHIVSFEAETIDNLGISACLISGLKEIMQTIPDAEYIFDGNTTFGISGLRCQVKADVDVPEVSAASILAKVTRDRYMVELSKKYPQYGFEKHKGYGTKAHIDAIAKNGLSPVHRKSFKIKSLEQPTLF